MMSNISEPFQAAKILWTGGWDSTFQLLRLLLMEKTCVQPYYLIDANRVSTRMEILTMHRICDQVKRRFPDVQSRLEPIKFFSVAQIPAHAEITRCYESLKKTYAIGSQYDWLARFCEDQEINRIQLCVHADDKFYAVFRAMRSFEQRGDVDSRDECDGMIANRVLQYFEFPIFDYSKLDMAEVSEKEGWRDIMDLTWFCHLPMKGRPCGRCNPCKFTIEEGLASRISPCRRMSGRLHRGVIRPSKQFLRKLLKG